MRRILMMLSATCTWENLFNLNKLTEPEIGIAA